MAQHKTTMQLSGTSNVNFLLAYQLGKTVQETAQPDFSLPGIELTWRTCSLSTSDRHVYVEKSRSANSSLRTAPSCGPIIDRSLRIGSVAETKGGGLDVAMFDEFAETRR